MKATNLAKSKKTAGEILDRKAKKALRREKQRAANIGRAKKFHAERLNLSKNKLKNNSSLCEPSEKLYVGCSGWFYWHWRGKLYPENSAPNDWFKKYQRHFNTVELNAPFYSWPTLNTVETWKKQATRKNFIYTIKVSELITHIKRFTGTKELIKDFAIIAKLLSVRMGCFLYQLPPSYTYSLTRLKQIVNQLVPGVRNVVEFRHASWWNNTVYTAFKKHNIIFCSVSSPKLPDELIKTSAEVYIRFHGKKAWYRHNYTKKELQCWVNRINSCGAKRVWIYFNNDREGYAVKNAKEIYRQINNMLK